MSFIGKTEERLIKTTDKRTFKLFITEQQGGVWITTVLYAKDGVIDAKNFVDTKREEAYRLASEWVLNNIDDKAIIEIL